MKVTLLLADSAQAVNGKLYVLGGGWSICGPDPTPMAIAIKIEVPWDRTNIKYPILVELVDADGQPVSLPGEGGVEAPLRIEGEIEVGRPVGVKAGTPLDAVIAINIGPVRPTAVSRGSSRSAATRTRIGESASQRDRVSRPQDPNLARHSRRALRALRNSRELKAGPAIPWRRRRPRKRRDASSAAALRLESTSPSRAAPRG
jgi:hypothetical protein